MEILPKVYIRYPEYSVITPQTNREFTVRSLNVQDEESLKSSSLTPSKFSAHLNDIIWQCIVKKPSDIKTIDDFKRKLTIKDREALMYALYHVSYKDVSEYEITCPSCEKSYPVKIDISKCITINMYTPTVLEKRLNSLEAGTVKGEKPYINPDIRSIKSEETPLNQSEAEQETISQTVDHDELINKRISVKLPVAQNITAIIKQPTLVDEETLVNDPLFQSTKQQNVGIELMIVDSFRVLPDTQSPERDSFVVTDRDSIYTVYKQLPSQDRKEIAKKYVEEFAKYGIELKVSSRCVFCNEESESNIDLVAQFFRALWK